ncbi:hypothetical protein EYF80_061339 [Liparis tanakae]|uniref:Uncharacterized protein n=1 Tax=Liparis tanakae TaxID=230148 RepID=A0A4Z2EJA4_9TELE|nr:hypothetical protein EYF80_061339 [Liparis tanakae]
MSGARRRPEEPAAPNCSGLSSWNTNTLTGGQRAEPEGGEEMYTTPPTSGAGARHSGRPTRRRAAGVGQSERAEGGDLALLSEPAASNQLLRRLGEEKV